VSCVVTEQIQGSPAITHGLRAGLEVLAIDGVVVTCHPLSVANAALWGPKVCQLTLESSKL